MPTDDRHSDGFHLLTVIEPAAGLEFDPPPPPQGRPVRHRCPECTRIVAAPPGAVLICGSCDLQLERVRDRDECPYEFACPRCRLVV